MHVLHRRRFWLSRVPAFVPASASAIIADADCIGGRRWPAVGVFNYSGVYMKTKPQHPSRAPATRMLELSC